MNHEYFLAQICELHPSDAEEAQLTLEQIFQMYPSLDHAYYRMQTLDANGATMVANEIEELFHFGNGNDETAQQLADSIQATCDSIKNQA
jgi:hypothetical protein